MVVRYGTSLKWTIFRNYRGESAKKRLGPRRNPASRAVVLLFGYRSFTKGVVRHLLHGRQQLPERACLTLLVAGQGPVPLQGGHLRQLVRHEGLDPRQGVA